MSSYICINQSRLKSSGFSAQLRPIVLEKIFLTGLILIAGLTADASAKVFVHDSIALKGEEIMLKAETKGRYFAMGGEMVEFFVDGKSIGKVLSGGDGFAYKSFITRKSGLHVIVAKSGKDEDSGTIMSLKKSSRIVFIDVISSLFFATLSKEQIEESREAIEKIIKKYPVVYLQRSVIGMRLIKEWLRKNRFPESAVLPWQMGAIFDDLNKKGIKIKAIIGSQPVIESAEEYKPMAFSFDEFGNTEGVKDWKEIEKRLR